MKAFIVVQFCIVVQYVILCICISNFRWVEDSTFDFYYVSNNSPLDNWVGHLNCVFPFATVKHAYFM